MSGRGGRDSGRWDPKRADAPRAQPSVLDRLIDDAPDDAHDPPISPSEAMRRLRRSVQRDLEALLNARRRWRSWPAHLRGLTVSPMGYGIPDFASGAFNERSAREELRAEIETTIRRFEPRFLSVSVTLVDQPDSLEPTLHMRIDALLRAEPEPERLAFDTVMETTTADVIVRSPDGPSSAADV
jgi:type VI secretion system protein ImpF